MHICSHTLKRRDFSILKLQCQVTAFGKKIDEYENKMNFADFIKSPKSKKIDVHEN